MSEEVITRDLSSGRIHRRWRHEGLRGLSSFEACNLDQGGKYEEIDEATVAEADESALCRRCFPRPSDVEGAPV